MRKTSFLILLFFILLNFTSFKKGIISSEKNTAPLIIGVEYTFSGMANALANTGIKGVKYFPDVYEWGDMQKKNGGPIDFSVTDKYVKEYEDAGFTNLVMALQSKCSWGSKDAGGLKPKNLSPKPECADQYKEYIAAVVERYDMDGKDDMSGLKAPVVYYEIGTEFSTYVPESADEYINTLTMAYKAAHDAFDGVKIMHAAFLTTTAITSKSTPETYEQDYAKVKQEYGDRILWHSLADDRKILDHPEIFDVVNFHSIGDPFEIEGISKWLQWEMDKRGYSKPLFISDTTPTPFIAWGNAVDCDKEKNQEGIIIPPFEESDRCKITQLFQKVLANDSASIKWLYGFLATDVVKKCVVAVDMHVIQINTSFAEDLALLKMKIMKAGAGTSAWAGMLATKINSKTNERTAIGYRPMYFALKQVTEALGNYQSIERIIYPDDHVRVYKIMKDGKENFIAWYEADKIPLPGEESASKTILIKTSCETVRLYNTVQISSEKEMFKCALVNVKDGAFSITINNKPVFANY